MAKSLLKMLFLLFPSELDSLLCFSPALLFFMSYIIKSIIMHSLNFFIRSLKRTENIQRLNCKFMLDWDLGLIISKFAPYYILKVINHLRVHASFFRITFAKKEACWPLFILNSSYQNIEKQVISVYLTLNRL